MFLDEFFIHINFDCITYQGEKAVSLNVRPHVVRELLHEILPHLSLCLLLPSSIFYSLAILP